MWERLVIVEEENVFLVAPDDDPEDWVVSFEKSVEFPARAWAERMTTLYNRRPVWSKFRSDRAGASTSAHTCDQEPHQARRQ